MSSAVPHKKSSFGLILLFLLGYVLTGLIVHKYVDEHAVKQVENQITELMLSYKAVRRLVREWHKPEVYRLQHENQLSDEYFSPYLLSTSFNARGFMSFLNEEFQLLGVDTFRFKLASDNPRNPVNQATADERILLDKMRNEGVQLYREVIVDPDTGEEYLSYSVPTLPVEQRCLKCHSDPADAPADLLKMYGDKAGFGEKIGNIRALLNVQLPMKKHYEQAHWLLAIIMTSLGVVLVVIYLIINFFMRRMHKQRRLIDLQNQQLEKLSKYDKLTSLLNRHGFEEKANDLLNLAFRYKENMTILIIDIDFFKSVNDNYGHLAGDKLLKNIAAVIRHTIRNTDVACRWGGEEFLVLSPKTSIADARILAERLRLAVAQTDNQLNEEHVRVTISLGLNALKAGDDLDNLIECADQALYLAKHSGRNRCETCEDIADYADSQPRT